MDKVFYGKIKGGETLHHHTKIYYLLMDAIDEDTGAGMTDKQLRDEILTIFVATRNHTQCFSLIFYLLDKNPGKIRKLLHEIDEHITDDKIDASILEDASFKMVIDEGMRIFPKFQLGYLEEKPWRW